MKHYAAKSHVAVKTTVGSSKESANAMSPYERVNRQLSMGMWALGVWLALVSLFFLKQTVDYVGLIARLAEWQFLLFDRYWPTLTFLALTLICSSPLILALWVIRQRQRRDEKLGPARIDDSRILAGRLMRLQSFFMGVAVGSLTAMVLSLFLMLQLPSDDGAPRSIVIGSPDAIAPADGPAILTGSVDVAETAQFNENVFFVKRTLYFAPIRSGPDDKSPLRYFVEVRRNDVQGNFNKIEFPKGRDMVRLWRYDVPGLSFTPYQSGVLRRRELHQRLSRFVPVVQGEIERPPVHREQTRPPEQIECLERVLRTEVNVAPRRVKRADFEHDEIERPELSRDVFVLGGEPRVAAEEHRVPLAANHQRRPERRVA